MIRLRLEKHPAGVVILVRAQPGSRRDEIRGEQQGALKVAVTQSPEKGKANHALIDLLAESLGLRKSQFELLSGHTSRLKKFLVRGVTPDELRGLLDSLGS